MTLLTAQILNDQIVGVDIPVPPKKYVNTPFKIEDTVSVAFSDISSIVNWEDYGHREELKRDYGFVRKEIKLLVAQKGIDTTISTEGDPSTIAKVAGDRYLVASDPVGDFADHAGAIAIVQGDLSWAFNDPENLGYFELTLEEKLIAIKYNIGDLSDHESDSEHGLSVHDIQEINAEYHRDSIENRYYRRQWAETVIYRDLPAYKGVVYAETSYSQAGNLILNYADAGVKGTEEDRTETNTNPAIGICDYLKSRLIFDGAGSTPGLSSKGWTPRGTRALEDVVQEIYDVLVYGIYR